jgi:hypothetical protein
MNNKRKMKKKTCNTRKKKKNHANVLMNYVIFWMLESEKKNNLKSIFGNTNNT